MVILKCTRDDFCCRCRSRIDQDNNGQAVGVITLFGKIAFGIALVATALRDDLAIIDEGIRNLDSFVEQATGV